jgi:DNA-directed RNA polymerase specialized sigma24 family protein
VPRRKPLPIDLEVKAALDALEPAALRRLTKFARRGVAQLALAGEPVASDEHEQIVLDAIADTMSLVVRWNRQTKAEQHLYSVILRRVSNRRRRAARRSGVSLETLDPDDAALRGPGSDLEASLGRAEVTQRVYRAACAWATDDPEVLSVLDTYRAGVSERRAVMARTGLTLAAFVNARRRLDRLLAGLPAELREPALAAMREPDISQVGEIAKERNIREISRQILEK